MRQQGMLKAAWKRCVSSCRRDELNVLRERTESGREFQIVGAAARKERKPKVRLVWELVSGQQRKMTREREKDGIEQGDARDNVGVSMHGLESKRTKLELHAPLN